MRHPLRLLAAPLVAASALAMCLPGVSAASDPYGYVGATDGFAGYSNFYQAFGLSPLIGHGRGDQPFSFRRVERVSGGVSFHQDGPPCGSDDSSYTDPVVTYLAIDKSHQAEAVVWFRQGVITATNFLGWEPYTGQAICKPTPPVHTRGIYLDINVSVVPGFGDARLVCWNVGLPAPPTVLPTSVGPSGLGSCSYQYSATLPINQVYRIDP